MLEIQGSSNVFKDKDGDASVFLYGISLAHCLPVAMNSEGSVFLVKFEFHRTKVTIFILLAYLKIVHNAFFQRKKMH